MPAESLDRVYRSTQRHGSNGGNPSGCVRYLCNVTVSEGGSSKLAAIGQFAITWHGTYRLERHSIEFTSFVHTGLQCQ